MVRQQVPAAPGKIAAEAGLWFAYKKGKRPGVVSETTFGAVLAGERTSTTRFLAWPGHRMWSLVVPGDLVRFHEEKGLTGRNVTVRVLSVAPISLATCDSETLEAWSVCEGWLPEKGRGMGAGLGPALWIRHELLGPPAAPQVRSAAQMTLF